MEAAGSDETLPFLLTRAMGPRGSNGPLGIQEDPRGGARRGTQGPFGRGMGPFGFIPKPFRMVSYSEGIPNGKLSRSQSDGNKFRSQSEWKGRSKWTTLPNRQLFHAFTQAVVKSRSVFWNKEIVRIWLETCIFNCAELGGF